MGGVAGWKKPRGAPGGRVLAGCFRGERGGKPFADKKAGGGAEGSRGRKEGKGMPKPRGQGFGEWGAIWRGPKT